MNYSKEQILNDFDTFSLGTGGIGSWLTKESTDLIFERLGEIDSNPLSKVQFNQLLVFGKQAPVSDDFFEYYWLIIPDHPYDVTKLPGYQSNFMNSNLIQSLAHLRWGLYRLFVDCLLWFGNVRTGFSRLRTMNSEELTDFFNKRKVNTARIKSRGPALKPRFIPKDERYLISEMACKSYGDDSTSVSKLREALIKAYREGKTKGIRTRKIRELLEGKVVENNYKAQQREFIFSADDILEESVNSQEELEEKYSAIADKFFETRKKALTNTSYFLSMCSDIDVYVATSMRARKDFREMADVCETIFAHPKVKDLNLRYFDPTLCAAKGHEDKGLIECLMVKCAKVLVYCAGEKESYGKDAEAAIALSLGKPVIFYCNQEQRMRFYRDVHPLSRLIEFDTGIAVGAMVTDSLKEVSELLYRIFGNKMEYRLDHLKPGYLRLKDTCTDSVIRLQTNDEMLTETFWNHYQNR